MNDRIFMLTGSVQHYEWGGISFLPDLLNRANVAHQPFAELWLGTHHKAPAVVATENGQQALAELLKEKSVELPFLMKILDVRQMLSIQTHPNKKGAEAGFKRENDAQIPLDAPHRNYKDDNHKPEMAVALTDFYLLHGFRAETEIAQTLREIPEFEPLQNQNSSLENLYRFIMEMPQNQVNEILKPLIKRIMPMYENKQLNKNEAHFWAARAAQTYNRAGQCDRGIFSIYLFNIVKLNIGEGIFQDAGLPHAYMEGVCVELMANSDNVLRGGLTPKHIDVPELMQHIHFESIKPHVLVDNSAQIENQYERFCVDFALSKIVLAAGKSYTHRSENAEIIIVLTGKGSINDLHELTRGLSVFVMPKTEYKIYAYEKMLIFKSFS